MKIQVASEGAPGIVGDKATLVYFQGGSAILQQLNWKGSKTCNSKKKLERSLGFLHDFGKQMDRQTWSPL